MNKNINIEDSYEIEFEDYEGESEEDIKKMALDVAKIIKRKETNDIKIEDEESKGEKIAEVIAEAFEGECGAFGGENPYLRGNKVTFHAQGPDESWIFNDDGSVDSAETEEEFIESSDPADYGCENEEELREYFESIKHFNSVRDLFDSGLSWFMYVNDESKVLKEIDDILKSNVKDTPVDDIPLKSPEEEISITHTEKLKGGKSPLTYGMIETAFKERGKDEGKTFRAYIDAAIESLKDDIANAKFIVSGEMKPVRKLLLEDYVKIEHLVEKAGMTDKLAEMKALVDELSEKLDLNYWKQPKFKKSTQKQASKELRSKHRWDSKIIKTMKPVFLCTKSDLTASYNDAKQGKLPEVFEGNLEKVRKDMEADYERIQADKDTYLEDPKIKSTLPEIIDLYDTALQYAEHLEYNDFIKEFKPKLDAIKEHWGLMGE